MARGHTRAPSQNAYRGTLGRTRTESVHITGPKGDLIVGTIYTTIDAVSDPELVERLHSDDPARALNVVRIDGGDPVHVTVPVVYHAPAAELLVLVLGEPHRHREIEERIRLLERLRDDDAPIPAYVKDFAVVFGADGLRAYLEQRAQQALTNAELLRQRQDLERAKAELERMRAESRARVIASVQMPAEPATIISAPPRPSAGGPSPVGIRPEPVPRPSGAG